jgi:hypothetical protein
LKDAEHASQTHDNELSELTTRSLRFAIELTPFSRFLCSNAAVIGEQWERN